MIEKILVIGGTGFIGFNFLKRLSKKKYQVYSISKKKVVYSKKIKNVKYLISDIKKINQLKKIQKKFDHIINLSGYVDHKNKKENDACHFQGTKNLIKVFYTKKLKSFIQIGSSLEYGKLKSPQKEKSVCKPVSIYGISKYKASKFIQEIGKKKNLPYIILRAYQVYGPYQKNDRLIPQTINACLKNKKFNCTSGNQLRDFIFIDDFCDLILKVIKKNKIRQKIFNIGSGKPISVKFIIKKIKYLTNKGSPCFGEISMRPDELLELYPSIKKIKKTFNWTPKISLNKGLKKTISFYEKQK